VIEDRNQSSLNRLLTESPFSLDRLNKARLRLLAAPAWYATEGERCAQSGCCSRISQEFEQIAQLFDHTNDSYVWAHNLVTLHYSDDETD
jgi:hypothetical protein